MSWTIAGNVPPPPPNLVRPPAFRTTVRPVDVTFSDRLCRGFKRHAIVLVEADVSATTTPDWLQPGPLVGVCVQNRLRVPYVRTDAKEARGIDEALEGFIEETIGVWMKTDLASVVVPVAIAEQIVLAARTHAVRRVIGQALNVLVLGTALKDRATATVSINVPVDMSWSLLANIMGQQAAARPDTQALPQSLSTALTDEGNPDHPSGAAAVVLDSQQQEWNIEVAPSEEWVIVGVTSAFATAVASEASGESRSAVSGERPELRFSLLFDDERGLGENRIPWPAPGGCFGSPLFSAALVRGGPDAHGTDPASALRGTEPIASPRTQWTAHTLRESTSNRNGQKSIRAICEALARALPPGYDVSYFESKETLVMGEHTLRALATTTATRTSDGATVAVTLTDIDNVQQGVNSQVAIPPELELLRLTAVCLAVRRAFNVYSREDAEAATSGWSTRRGTATVATAGRGPRHYGRRWDPVGGLLRCLHGLLRPTTWDRDKTDPHQSLLYGVYGGQGLLDLLGAGLALPRLQPLAEQYLVRGTGTRALLSISLVTAYTYKVVADVDAPERESTMWSRQRLSICLSSPDLAPDPEQWFATAVTDDNPVVAYRLSSTIIATSVLTGTVDLPIFGPQAPAVRFATRALATRGVTHDANTRLPVVPLDPEPAWIVECAAPYVVLPGGMPTNIVLEKGLHELENDPFSCASNMSFTVPLKTLARYTAADQMDRTAKLPLTLDFAYPRSRIGSLRGAVEWTPSIERFETHLLAAGTGSVSDALQDLLFGALPLAAVAVLPETEAEATDLSLSITIPKEGERPVRIVTVTCSLRMTVVDPCSSKKLSIVVNNLAGAAVLGQHADGGITLDTQVSAAGAAASDSIHRLFPEGASVVRLRCNVFPCDCGTLESSATRITVFLAGGQDAADFNYDPRQEAFVISRRRVSLLDAKHTCELLFRGTAGATWPGDDWSLCPGLRAILELPSPAGVLPTSSVDDADRGDIHRVLSDSMPGLDSVQRAACIALWAKVQTGADMVGPGDGAASGTGTALLSKANEALSGAIISTSADLESHVESRGPTVKIGQYLGGGSLSRHTPGRVVLVASLARADSNPVRRKIVIDLGPSSTAEDVSTTSVTIDINGKEVSAVVLAVDPTNSRARNVATTNAEDSLQHWWRTALGADGISFAEVHLGSEVSMPSSELPITLAGGSDGGEAVSVDLATVVQPRDDAAAATPDRHVVVAVTASIRGASNSASPVAPRRIAALSYATAEIVSRLHRPLADSLLCDVLLLLPSTGSTRTSAPDHATADDDVKSMIHLTTTQCVVVCDAILDMQAIGAMGDALHAMYRFADEETGAQALADWQQLHRKTRQVVGADSMQSAAGPTSEQQWMDTRDELGDALEVAPRNVFYSNSMSRAAEDVSQGITQLDAALTAAEKIVKGRTADKRRRAASDAVAAQGPFEAAITQVTLLSLHGTTSDVAAVATARTRLVGLHKALGLLRERAQALRPLVTNDSSSSARVFDPSSSTGFPREWLNTVIAAEHNVKQHLDRVSQHCSDVASIVHDLRHAVLRLKQSSISDEGRVVRAKVLDNALRPRAQETLKALLVEFSDRSAAAVAEHNVQLAVLTRQLILYIGEGLAQRQKQQLANLDHVPHMPTTTEEKSPDRRHRVQTRAVDFDPGSPRVAVPFSTVAAADHSSAALLMWWAPDRCDSQPAGSDNTDDNTEFERRHSDTEQGRLPRLSILPTTTSSPTGKRAP